MSNDSNESRPEFSELVQDVEITEALRDTKRFDYAQKNAKAIVDVLRTSAP